MAPKLGKIQIMDEMQKLERFKSTMSAQYPFLIRLMFASSMKIRKLIRS